MGNNLPSDTITHKSGMTLLSRAADLAVILTCLVIAGALAVRYVRPTVELSAAENVIAPGAVFEHAGPAGASRTVLLVVHSQCHFCSESMPLYRELQARVSRSSSQYELRVIGIEPVETLQTYLTQYGLFGVSIETRKRLDGIKGTPTLVVLDRDRRVIKSWTGRLSQAQETNLRSMFE